MNERHHLDRRSLELSITDTTRALQDNLEQILREWRHIEASVHDFKDSLDVSARARRRPFATLGLAVLSGVVLGALSGHRRPAARAQRLTGTAALGTLALSVIRPILLTAARDVVTRHVGHQLGQRTLTSPESAPH